MTVRRDIDDNRIVKLYVNKKMTMPQIAGLLGCGVNTVRERLQKSGIKRRFPGPVHVEVDGEILRDLYVNEGLTINAIAKRFGTTDHTIWAKLKRERIPLGWDHTLPRPGPLNKRADVDIKTVARLYLGEKKSTMEIADILGCGTATVCRRLLEAGIKARWIMPRKYHMDEKTLRDLYVNKRLSTETIAKHFGCSRRVVEHRMREGGIKARTGSGPGGPKWQGGRRLYHGSIAIYNPLHPNANNRGFVKEHILKASEVLGRPLKKGEVVHHIDGDPTNNENANLFVCPWGYHGWIEKRMARLYQREHFGRVGRPGDLVPPGPRGGERRFAKGARCLWAPGYVVIKDPFHPHAFGAGYVWEHILKATRVLGRPLKRGEQVHHIDGDRANNENGNLLICTSAYHTAIRERMAYLYKREHFGKRDKKSRGEEAMEWISWVGVKFYSIPSFIREARAWGVSRRLKPSTLKQMNFGDRIYLTSRERGLRSPVVFGYFHLETIKGIRLDGEARARMERETGKTIEVVFNDLSIVVRRMCGYLREGGLYACTEARVEELMDYGETEDPEVRGALVILKRPWPALWSLKPFRGFRPFDGNALRKDLAKHKGSRRPILKDLYYV